MAAEMRVHATPQEKSLATTSPEPTRGHTIAAAIAISLITALVFWPGLGGGFILDDFVNLLDNPDLRVQWGDSLHAWWSAAWSSPAGGLSRPIAMLSFAFDHAMWGLDATAWKRTNLLLHGLNALLTLALSDRLLRAVNVNGRTALVAASLLALAWAIHPLQVSSVLYAVQRMELLGHTFALLALLSYAHARQLMLQGRNGWPWLVAFALAASLGVFAKETVSMVPAMAIAMELVLFRFAAARERDRQWLRWLTAVGIVVFTLALCYLFLRFANADSYSAREFGWVERILTQLRVLATYVRWILVPIPTAYLFYYDHIAVSTGLLSPATTLLSGAFLLTLTACACCLRSRIPLFTLGVSWFFLGHLLTAGPIPLEIAFEHRNYGPSYGLLLALAGLLLFAMQRFAGLRTAILAISGGFIALSLFGTVLRSWEWGDPLRLVSNTASRAPESARAQHSYGTTMIMLTGFDASNPMFHVGRNSIIAATKLPGTRPQAQAILIEAHTRAGLDVEAEWWGSLHSYMQTHGMDHHATDVVLSLVTCRLGPDCSINDQDLQALLASAVGTSEANEPSILLAYGDFAFNVMNDWELAERLYRGSVEAATRSPHFRTSLASLLLRIGKLDEAQAELQVADNLDRLGRYRDEREQLRRSIEGARVQGQPRRHSNE